MSNIQKKTETGMAQSPEAQQIQNKITASHAVDIDNINSLDSVDFENVQTKPFSLTPEYWSPEGEGETKVLVYTGINQHEKIPDFNDSNNMVEKPTAMFIEQRKDKDNKKTYYLLKNASSRLVSTCEALIPGHLYEVTYLGKKKNKNNSNMSARWRVLPVYIPEENKQ